MGDGPLRGALAPKKSGSGGTQRRGAREEEKAHVRVCTTVPGTIGGGGLCATNAMRRY